MPEDTKTIADEINAFLEELKKTGSDQFTIDLAEKVEEAIAKGMPTKKILSATVVAITTKQLVENLEKATLFADDTALTFIVLPRVIAYMTSMLAKGIKGGEELLEILYQDTSKEYADIVMMRESLKKRGHAEEGNA